MHICTCTHIRQQDEARCNTNYNEYPSTVVILCINLWCHFSYSFYNFSQLSTNVGYLGDVDHKSGHLTCRGNEVCYWPPPQCPGALSRCPAGDDRRLVTRSWEVGNILSQSGTVNSAINRYSQALWCCHSQWRVGNKSRGLHNHRTCHRNIVVWPKTTAMTHTGDLIPSQGRRNRKNPDP